MAKDSAHEFSDAEIRAFEREVAGVYGEVGKTAYANLKRYLAQFEADDEKMRGRLDAGEITKAQYRSWRSGKIAAGRRYRIVLKQCAEAMTHANVVAAAAIEGRLPEVYAENYNYGTWQAYSAACAYDAFALQDASTVQRLLTDHDSYLPKPSVNVAKDVAWNRRLIANQITQGVLLGESIPKIAKRMQDVTGANRAAAVRLARTSTTAAENTGRVDSYKRAKGLGIKVKQEWLATLDGRTRSSHRKLDGEKVEIGEKFSNGCRYPGDPEAPYAETCNCRCTLIAAVEGVDYSDGKCWSRLPEGMTYEEMEGRQARRHRHQIREPHHLRVHGHARHGSQARRRGRVADRGEEEAHRAAQGVRHTVRLVPQDERGRPAEGAGHSAGANSAHRGQARYVCFRLLVPQWGSKGCGERHSQAFGQGCP